jgi:hypothetical protein
MKKIVIVLVLVSYALTSVAKPPKKPDCIKWTWNKNTVVCLKWRA